jgi:hydroxyacylglutathione hydrolase
MAAISPQHLEEVPRDKPIAVVCGSGYRSSVAASVLRRAGFDHVTNVSGSMTAWDQAHLPTTTNGVN